MEEAVRLFYVGMTRAKSHLELLSYRIRDGGQTKESRFMSHVRHLQSGPRQAAANPASASATAAGREVRKPAAAPEAKRAKPVKKNTAKAELNPEEKQLLARIRETGSAHHLKFGQGEVVHLDEATIHIRFEGGVKKLLVAACLKTGLLTPV
jgi:DNA helicase-2/ATP-dependent DNA helicase PcrA